MIEIVTHCWAKDLPQYAVFLRHQLASLILYRPMVEVQISVCFCEQDVQTEDVLCEFAVHTDLCLSWFCLSREKLGRRAIGRNMLAKRTEADIVWFADVDMVFREGCLDELWMKWLEHETEWRDVSMMWVGDLFIQRTHDLGDKLAGGSLLRLPDIDPDEFVPKRYNRGVGGVQIVPGRAAREHGYLDGNKRWLAPQCAGNEFRDFRDDVVFRRGCERRGRVLEIAVPELYRLRHTKTTYKDRVL